MALVGRQRRGAATGACAALVALGPLWMVGACAPGPAHRMGALPYPGMLSLYDTPSVTALGAHRSRGGLLGGGGARGIVYTRNAGFLDLAHVRLSVDWTRYLAERLARDEQPVVVRRDGARFVLSLPPGADVAHAASRAAYLIMTWHEVATWHGSRTVFFVSESRSAFTWDDDTSHVVGVQLARELLLQHPDVSEHQWDRLVTEALQERLRTLGIVTPEEADAAARRVRGRWWSGEVPLRRDMDLCLTDAAKHAWLGPGERSAPLPAPEPLRDGQLLLKPDAWLARAAGLTGTSMDAEEALRMCTEAIRAQLAAQSGEDALVP